MQRLEVSGAVRHL